MERACSGRMRWEYSEGAGLTREGAQAVEQLAEVDAEQ